MERLTPWQLALMLVCARCFSMMTYFPYTGSNTLIFMAAILASAAIQGILLIPAVRLCSRTGKSLCSTAMCTDRTLGIAVTAAFLGYFVWDIFLSTGNFAYYTDQYFSNRVPGIPAVILACVAALYLAAMKISVIGRCAGIMFAVFAIFTAVLMLSASGDPDITNFHLAQRDILTVAADDVKNEFVRNKELVLLVFLLGDVRGSKTRSVCSYLWVKLLILETVMGFVTLMLGELALETDMPFFYLSCSASSSMVERYDAGFMSVWTVMAVLRLAVVIHCAARCIRQLASAVSIRTAAAISCAVPIAAAFLLLCEHRWKDIAYLREPPLVIAALIALLPIAVSVIRARKERKNEI